MDIVKEIKKDMKGLSEVNDLEKRTEIPLPYFISKVLRLEPTLVAVEIKTYTSKGKTYNWEDCLDIDSFFSSLPINRKYYYFINKDVLDKFIKKYNFPISKTYYSYEIDLNSRFDLKEEFDRLASFKLRYYAEEKANNCVEIKTVSVYENKRFALVSINSDYSQEILNNMCLNVIQTISKYLYNNRESSIGNYERLIIKLLNGDRLFEQDKELIISLIEDKENTIKEDKTIFKRSLKKK